MKYTNKPNQNVGFVSEEELKKRWIAESNAKGCFTFCYDHRSNLTAYRYLLKILGLK